jgi:hypothetical protein
LFIEWAVDQTEPTKYWLSTCPLTPRLSICYSTSNSRT